MQISTASKHDLITIMEIVSQAQSYLASLNIDQWQNGYPDEKVILNDIKNNESYLVKNKENDVMGIAMFTTKTEPTYQFIEGKWLTNDNARYGVIHRMAVADKFRSYGVAKFIFKHCETYLKQNNIPSMRIDTHQDNIGMQNLLHKLGYNYCGIIYLTNGDKRLAFEKLIS